MTLRFFFPALPSEHGAWSVNSRNARKQKRVKLELLRSLFTGRKAETTNKQNKKNKRKQTNKQQNTRSSR